MQEYTIQEAVKELKISRATLYNRINKYKQPLNGHISLKEGRTYISKKGLEILESNEDLDDCLDNLNDHLDNLDNKQQELNEVLEVIKCENEFLRNQILQKDNQLLEKDNQIQTLLRLNENSQILLKQEQDIKMLPKEKENKLKTFFTKYFT